MFHLKLNNRKIFLDLAHIHEKAWSGGKSRSTQTLEIFTNAGYVIEELKEPHRPPKLILLLWSLKALLKFGYYKPFSVIGLRVSGYDFFKYSYFHNLYPNTKTYLIEGTGFGALHGVAILKYFEKNVILLPINVESLAPYHGAWTHSLPILDRFAEEVKYYKKADAVFCIAEEEDWLLKMLNVTSYFLPYYPPSVIETKIHRRKELRKLVPRTDFSLYFANFFNVPNLLGFEQYIKEGLYKNNKIKIAGLGTEKILPMIGAKMEFTVLGELSEQELEDELINCNNVILNHFPTSGMLTRIPELLLSGIEVKGNASALKAYILTCPGDNAPLHLKQLSEQSYKKLLDFVSNLSLD